MPQIFSVVSVFLNISSFLFLLFVQFGELGGFTAIQTKLNADEIEIAVRLSSPTFVFHTCGQKDLKSDEIVTTLVMNGETDRKQTLRRPIQAKGHHVYPYCSQLQGAECPSLSPQ